MATVPPSAAPAPPLIDLTEDLQSDAHVHANRVLRAAWQTTCLAGRCAVFSFSTRQLASSFLSYSSSSYAWEIHHSLENGLSFVRSFVGSCKMLAFDAREIVIRRLAAWLAWPASESLPLNHRLHVMGAGCHTKDEGAMDFRRQKIPNLFPNAE